MKSKLLLMLSLFFVVACSEDRQNSVASKPPVKAPDSIDESFGVSADRHALTIKHDALEKEFLLQAQLISQSPLPMFENLKSRVVSFRFIEATKVEKDAGYLGNVYMLEATKGHVINNELPSKIILAQFPVLKLNRQGVTINFNHGMSHLYVAGDWRASDYSGRSYDEENEFQSVSVNNSYVEESKLSKNRLSITQYAQLMVAGDSNTIRHTVRAKYYLQPYRPNTQFVPTESHSFDRMGFFEIAPQQQEFGPEKVYASKFDHTKPITFAVSANTPQEYRKAVRDGILYWNKAFGKEVLKAVDAPAGVTGPDIDYNVVQWVNWDSAGFAYADAQMDPRNGEILHAQVFMTSVFAVIGRARARRILNTIKASDELAEKRVFLKGFMPESRCDRFAHSSFASNLQELLDSDATDDQILRMSQDYVAEVVAHEIGHTLGLRHNFAGNLVTNFPLSERKKVLDGYLNDATLDDDTVTSSSVMEYQLFTEGAFTGHSVAHAPKALEYDEKVIQVLYEGKEYADSEMPVFCTDSHAAQGYIDCQRFDAGPSVVEHVKWAFENEKSLISNTLLEAFIAAKVPLAGPSKDVATVLVDPKGLAGRVMQSRPVLIDALSEKSKVLEVHRSFPSVDVLNEGAVKEKGLDVLAQQIDAQGGLDSVLAPIGSDFTAVQLAKFIDLLEANKSGTSIYGTAYSFDAQEVEVIKERAELILEKLYKELVAEDIAQLSAFKKAKKLADHSLSEDVAEMMEARVANYLYLTDGETLTVDIEVPAPKEEKANEEDSAELVAEAEVSEEESAEDDSEESVEDEKEVEMISQVVNLPVYSLEQDLRLQIAGLVKGTVAEAPEWGHHTKKDVADAHKESMKEIFGDTDHAALKYDDLPAAMVRWLIQNKAVASKM